MADRMELSKRNVLIISYVWPPMEGVGLIRAMKFAKYLPQYGWEPIILTVNALNGTASSAAAGDTGVKIFRTEYRDVVEDFKRLFFAGKGADRKRRGGGFGEISGDKKKAPSLIREMLSMPDDQIGWRRFAIEEGKKIVAKEGVTAVISTSPPETAHLVAQNLKRTLGIPWIADLRDLWADDHFRDRPFIKKLALRCMEKSVLKDADKVITVSEPWAKTLGNSLGGISGKIEVIENGFDEEDFAKAEYGRNSKFTICYTGKLHAGRQPVRVFFSVLRDLIREGHIDRSRIEIRFYVMGYDKPDIAGMALSYGLEGVVVEFGKVGYQRSLEIQGAADALLFVQWQGNGGEGWYSAKLYDYIGSRRPILALTSKNGIVADLILGTSSGIIASNEADIRSALLMLYGEYAEKGLIKYGGNEAEIAKHSRNARARRLAAILDSLARRPASPAASIER